MAERARLDSSILAHNFGLGDHDGTRAFHSNPSSETNSLLATEGLRFCDCEILLDRTYYLPLADAGWPDDTLVVFDFMESPDAAR